MTTLNPFDLLDEGKRRKAAPKPKTAAPPAATQAVAKPAAAQTAKPAQQQQQASTQQKASTAKVAPLPNATNAKDAAPRPKPQGGDAQKGRRDGERRPPRQQGGIAPAGDALPGDGEKSSQRPPRSGHDRRGDRPGRGRQFDRRSGTGRPANENKRSGGGMGNWGVAGEEGAAVEGSTVKEALENEEVDKAPATDATKEEAEQAPKEPELKGLDEYYESIKDKKVKIDAPKRREAGEGVDQSAWAGFVPLAKEEDSDGIIKQKKKEVAKKDSGAEVVETSFYFPSGEDTRRGRGGDRRGGDRRGGRGGGDRRGGDRRPGGNRQGGDRRHDGKDFKSFESDFPALSSSGGVAPPQAVKPAAPAQTAAAPASSAPVKA